MIGSRPKVVAGLRTPLLAVIRARPGVTHNAALRELKRDGRVARGVRMGEAADAVRVLAQEGLIARTGAWGWKVQ